MKVDNDGRIAYHSHQMREDGGLDYIQYDFDGKIESIEEVRPARELVEYNHA